MPALTKSARDNLAACVAMIVLTAFTVITRFAIKACRGQAPAAADWMCLLSVPLFYAYCGLIIHFILNTSLYGSFDIKPARGPVELKNILKMTYATEILFGLVITTVKLSILWFYYTIFAVPNSAFNKSIIKGTAVICVVWFLIVNFLVVFQCTPVHAYWDMLAMAPYCIDSPRLLLGYEMTNLFLDVVILCIPVAILRGVQLESSKKMGILAIFLLGAFVCVASIVRLTTIWAPPEADQSFDYAASMMWSTMQLGIAITCACLPTLAPLLPTIRKPFVYLSSWHTSVWSRANAYSANQKHTPPPPYEMPDTSNQPPSWVPFVGFHGPSENWAYGNHSQGYIGHDIDSVPLRTIRVTRDVQVATCRGG